MQWNQHLQLDILIIIRRCDAMMDSDSRWLTQGIGEAGAKGQRGPEGLPATLGDGLRLYIIGNFL